MSQTLDPALPLETFSALSEARVIHGFVGRVPGIDVDTTRAEAIARLEPCHREARQALGIGGRTFATAEQVHGDRVIVLAAGGELPPFPCVGADGIVTNRLDVCLGIYVADCGAVYLADPVREAIGLVHSGKKGTELGIAVRAVEAMRVSFGSEPADLVVQVSPCIRPPWYEIDFAAEIVSQCRAAGVVHVRDSGVCTAANPDRYYSYRREKGRTGRMLALLAFP